MSQSPESSSSSEDADLSTADEDTILSLSADDIEAAYERALQAVTTAEQVMNADGEDDLGEGALDGEPSEPKDSSTESSVTPSTSAPEPVEVDEFELPRDGGESRIQPRQVIEAALFVGGGSLTSKRLGSMLGEDSSADDIEELVAGLNAQYADEHRPYEIRLGEGGYQLLLREEFQPVQDRVFGTSPKDVKLSQEALEVLAFVAYRQPVPQDGLEETGKPNAASLVRQLLRRQLVCLERGDDSTDDVTYRTTPRFLELFGLRSLNDLPLPEDLMLK